MNNPTLAALISGLHGWQVLIDILLIAAGLFFLYRTLLRLGTWRIVAGIIIALIVFNIANFLNLQGMEWIFGNLSHVALLALIVIFQPELRKTFERAASVRRSKRRRVESDLPFIIADSLMKLAEQKRGAIVVFPGKESVEEWLSGGFKLDAMPSIPLMMSIFDPNSPGHDGALVVEQTKFSRFGVRLPVSDSLSLSEEFGTRHHAAMGLAEKSDALVIIVSEERGKVAYFIRGKMRPVPDREKLVGTIIAHWKKTASLSLTLPEKKARWKVVLEMSVSISLAILLWLTIVPFQGEIMEKSVVVPVTYSAAAPNMVLVGDQQTEVRLHLAGPKSDLYAFDTSQLNVKMDLSKAEAGKQTLPVPLEAIKLPKDIKLLGVIPSSFELTLAEVELQEVPVTPQLVGKLTGKRKINAIDITPAKVWVRTPKIKEKNSAITVTTTPIYLEGIYGDTTLYCKIIAPPAVQPETRPWPDVKVLIKLGKQ